MASLFSKPDMGPAPTPDNRAAELAAAAQRERLARGRASTILTGAMGVEAEPVLSSNVLLGA